MCGIPRWACRNGKIEILQIRGTFKNGWRVSGHRTFELWTSNWGQRECSARLHVHTEDNWNCRLNFNFSVGHFADYSSYVRRFKLEGMLLTLDIERIKAEVKCRRIELATWCYWCNIPRLCAIPSAILEVHEGRNNNQTSFTHSLLLLDYYCSKIVVHEYGGVLLIADQLRNINHQLMMVLIITALSLGVMIN